MAPLPVLRRTFNAASYMLVMIQPAGTLQPLVEFLRSVFLRGLSPSVCSTVGVQRARARSKSFAPERWQRPSCSLLLRLVFPGFVLSLILWQRIRRFELNGRFSSELGIKPELDV